MVAKLIVEKALELGVNASLGEAYSGRGMFGRETTGIIVDGPSDIMEVCAALTAGIDNPQDLRLVLAEIRAFRLDSMGLAYIYY